MDRKFWQVLPKWRPRESQLMRNYCCVCLLLNSKVWSNLPRLCGQNPGSAHLAGRFFRTPHVAAVFPCLPCLPSGCVQIPWHRKLANAVLSAALLLFLCFFLNVKRCKEIQREAERCREMQIAQRCPLVWPQL